MTYNGNIKDYETNILQRLKKRSAYLGANLILFDIENAIEVHAKPTKINPLKHDKNMRVRIYKYDCGEFYSKNSQP